MSVLASTRWAGAFEKADVERYLLAATAERDRVRQALVDARDRLDTLRRTPAAARILEEARREVESMRRATEVRIGTIVAMAEAEAAELLLRADRATRSPVDEVSDRRRR